MTYTENDIKQLSDLAHAQTRPTIYVGDTNLRKISLPRISGNVIEFVEYEVSLGYIVCIREIIDNAIDIIRHTGVGKTVKINYWPKKGNRFSVRDDSVGVPIGIHKDTGMHTPEMVFSTLRSGKNFDTDKFIIGMNGMGAALTNFFSNRFKVIIYRDNKIYHQLFKDAEPVNPPKIIDDPTKIHTGTSIEFNLDKSYFNEYIPSEDFIQHFVQILADFNTDIRFKYNNRIVKTKGIRGYKVPGSIYKKTDAWELLIFPDINGPYNMFSSVNGIPTIFGGSHVSRFEWLFVEHVKKMLKLKDSIYKNNILKGLTVIMALKDVPDIQFDTQAKTKLITHDVEIYQTGMSSSIIKFIKSKNGWTDWINEQFEKKAVNKQLRKRKKNGKRKYYHAKSKTDREVYIVEGLSALAPLLPVRNNNQGCLPLRGKIVNATTRSLSNVVKSDTIYNIIEMLNIKLGEDNNACKYDKIILATDQDADGLHIQSLVINLFFHLAPELIDRIYILESPLYVVETKKTYDIYFTKESFKKAKVSKGADVRYNKGLGSLTKKEWEVMVDPKKRQLTKVINSDNKITAKTLSRLFGWDSSCRKKWLKGSGLIHDS